MYDAIPYLGVEEAGNLGKEGWENGLERPVPGFEEKRSRTKSIAPKPSASPG